MVEPLEVGKTILARNEDNVYVQATIALLDNASSCHVRFMHDHKALQTKISDLLKPSDWLTEGRLVLVKTRPENSNNDSSEYTAGRIEEVVTSNDDPARYRISSNSKHQMCELHELALTEQEVRTTIMARKNSMQVFHAGLLLVAVFVLVGYTSRFGLNLPWNLTMTICFASVTITHIVLGILLKFCPEWCARFY